LQGHDGNPVARLGVGLGGIEVAGADRVAKRDQAIALDVLDHDDAAQP
jgi:hypothetical protein